MFYFPRGLNGNARVCPFSSKISVFTVSSNSCLILSLFWVCICLACLNTRIKGTCFSHFANKGWWFLSTPSQTSSNDSWRVRFHILLWLHRTYRRGLKLCAVRWTTLFEYLCAYKRSWTKWQINAKSVDSHLFTCLQSFLTLFKKSVTVRERLSCVFDITVR